MAGGLEFPSEIEAQDFFDAYVCVWDVVGKTSQALGNSPDVVQNNITRAGIKVKNNPEPFSQFKGLKKVQITGEITKNILLLLGNCDNSGSQIVQ